MIDILDRKNSTFGAFDLTTIPDLIVLIIIFYEALVFFKIEGKEEVIRKGTLFYVI
jgi:hypothetical protein